MLNWVLSLLVHYGELTYDEAEYIAAELIKKTHPQGFKEAHLIVAKLLKEYEDKK